jgi:hypothetical protein
VRHLHFAFTGVIDQDGFAVYEEQAESGANEPDASRHLNDRP